MRELNWIRIVPALFVILFATAVARDGHCDSEGLWVTLDHGGHAYRVEAKDETARAYVRAFVAGNATVEIPGPIRDGWLRALGLAPAALAPFRLHITSATECHADGSCVRLRGLYAGRSPDS